MRRGKKLAKLLRARIQDWENMSAGKSNNMKAFRKPGAKPGDYAKRYGE